MNPLPTIQSRNVSPRPQRRRALKYRLSGVLNAFPRMVLRSPLHWMMSGGFVLLSVPGRWSGKVYSIPVAYLDHDDTLLIGTDRPWRRNLRSGDLIHIRYKGNRRRALVRVHDEQPEVGRLFGVILRQNPVLPRFMNIRMQNGEPHRVDLEGAVDRGAAVIELRLE